MIEKLKRNIILNLPGMRVIKTMISVIIAMAISQLIKIGDLSSIGTIAVFSILPSFEETKSSAIHRLTGVAIAGLYTFFSLTFIKNLLRFTYNSTPYVIFIMLFLIVLMQFIVLSGHKESFGYAVVIYIGICFGYENYYVVDATILKVLESLIAIGVTMFVNSRKSLNNIDEKITKLKSKYIDLPYSKNNGKI